MIPHMFTVLQPKKCVILFWRRAWDSKGYALRARKLADPIVFGFAERGSNPLFFNEKNIEHYLAVTLYIFWRRAWDSNPRNAFDVYTISNRAPSTSSDNSPSVQINKGIKS